MASAGSIFVDLQLKDANYVAGLNKARRSTRDFSGQVKSDMGSAGSAFSGVNKSVSALSSSLKAFAGIALASFSVSNIIKYSDEFKKLEGRLSLVTKGSDDFVRSQSKLFEIAQSSRSDLDATVTLYQRVTSAVKGLGVTQNEVFTFTEQLNKQLITAGLSSQEAAATIYQLTQAFNKGKLDGDEFRTMLESAPPILEALERSLGVTRGEILEMSKAGQLAPRVLIDAVNSMAYVTNARFGQFKVSVGQAFQILENSLLTYIGLSPDVALASKVIADSIIAVSRSIDYMRENSINLTTAIGGLVASYYELAIANKEYAIRGNELTNLFGLNDDAIKRHKVELDGLKNTYQGLSEVIFDVNNRRGSDSVPVPEFTMPESSSIKPSSYTKLNKVNYDQIYKKNEELITGLTSKQLQYNSSIDDLNTLLESNKITNGEFDFAMKNLNESFAENSEAVTSWGINIDELGKSAATNIQSSFADFLFDPFKDGLQGMALGFVNTIRKMMAEAAAANLTKSLFGEMGGGYGGGILGSILGGLGGMFGGGAGSIGASGMSGGLQMTMPYFADGGYLPPGQVGIAGEAGAELIYGGKTGVSVFNQDQLGKKGNTYNIDARGADQGAVARIERALIALAGPGVTENRISQAQKRGSM